MEITQTVYYYVDDEGNKVIDEEETLNDFKDQLALIILDNMGIS